jgi:uncharacterized protein (DUF433 family)
MPLRACQVKQRPRRHVLEVVAMKFTRITVSPLQMGGIPCVHGLRIPVATVVGMLAAGMTTEEILKAYPDLRSEDIREAVQYAAEAVRERELPLVRSPSMPCAPTHSTVLEPSLNSGSPRPRFGR